MYVCMFFINGGPKHRIRSPFLKPMPPLAKPATEISFKQQKQYNSMGTPCRDKSYSRLKGLTGRSDLETYTKLPRTTYRIIDTHQDTHTLEIQNTTYCSAKHWTET